MSNQLPEPTLAEIVAGRRAAASILETFDKNFPGGAASGDIALLRAAADRLEGLANLAREVRHSTKIGGLFADGYALQKDWFVARDRLLK